MAPSAADRTPASPGCFGIARGSSATLACKDASTTWASYPGATPSNGPNDWVRGEVFRLNQPAKTLAALDAYEGPQFGRAPQRVYLASGMTLAWVYLYRGNPTGTRIISGAWPVRRA